MKKDSCPYCGNLEVLKNFGYIAWESETSLFIVFKDQSHPGRMIVAYKKDHVAEIKDLDVEERNKFMDDVCRCANAISDAYHPQRINYGAYGDTLGHLHIHIVPKYENEFEWGGTFQMNTGNLVDEKSCEEVAKKVKACFK